MARSMVRLGRSCSALMGALAIVFIFGCGESGPRRVPVVGEVTLDGAPLSEGIVHFCPDNAKGNSHRIDCMGGASGGKFSLITAGIRSHETGSGVPLGWYKVYLFTQMNKDSKLKIHPKYTDEKKTPISVEVVDNAAPGAYDVKFTSK